ncbi:hypothetical protein E2C01_056497 [Portunus trituberculatus]|uniref:Uncharacterized protein n=1 Tax=Portunus trituberculatus TaxID=210409 RepID=A0A5B7GUA6_PORTR|nr:hypothetical protein [Portunus trituberculatus]
MSGERERRTFNILQHAAEKFSAPPRPAASTKTLLKVNGLNSAHAQPTAPCRRLNARRPSLTSRLPPPASLASSYTPSFQGCRGG